jgi:septum site-determining protein MinC
MGDKLMEALSKSAVAEATRAATRSQAAFELKGVHTPLTVMRLRTTNLNLIERQLRAKLLQTPQFFQDAPVVLDLTELADLLDQLPLPSLVHVLRSMRVVPMGATGIPDTARDFLRAAGLTLGQTGPGKVREEAPAARAETPAPEKPAPQKAAAEKPAPEKPAEKPAARAAAKAAAEAPRTDPHKPPLVLRQAVRSGQEIYARQTDLIVMAPVNPGAQIYADGHIHIYSTLRGRAMAGAQGLTDARIYVQKLEAELVAVAGAYLAADDIPADRRGKPCQVFLENGECKLAPL